MSANVAAKMTRPTLSSEASRLMIDAAVAQARKLSVPITVVAVDESGVTKEMLRMDGAPLVSVQTAINKAYAAAAIGMPPDDFYAAIESDEAAVTEFGTRPGLALIAGGLPVLTDGEVAGAIGVAGAMTAAEDRRIAEAATRRPPTPSTSCCSARSTRPSSAAPCTATRARTRSRARRACARARRPERPPTTRSRLLPRRCAGLRRRSSPRRRRWLRRPCRR